MEEIKLTDNEKYRYDIIRSCIYGDITNKEAGGRLGLKIRQVQMLKRAIESTGAQGIIHGLKYKTAHNSTNTETVKKVTTFFKNDKHKDFGPTFAQEKLGISMSIETLRTIMISNGLWKEKKRRGPQIHREWRERMGSFGELVQFDGCYHRWFENGEEHCLLAAIDDATGNIVHAVFEDNEGVHAVFRFWWSYITTYGRPVAIYLDKFSTYKINHKNAVDNPEFITQFQRAMKELDIRVICAHSPEGKGSVERLFLTIQDRMIKEMRLADIKTRDTANQFMYEKYIPDHNGRFSVQARNESDAHRPLTDELCNKLHSIFSIQSKRKIRNDYTIQFKNEWFQLESTQGVAVYKRDEVTIEECLDDTIYIKLKDTYLKYRKLPERPKKVSIPVVALTTKAPTWRPPASHPWKKSFKKI
jgi:hypothetical protein